MRKLLLIVGAVLPMWFASDEVAASEYSQYSISKTGPTSSATGGSQVYGWSAFVNAIRDYFNLGPMYTNVPTFYGKIEPVPKTDPEVQRWLDYEQLRRWQTPESWKSSKPGTINDGGSRPSGSCDSKC